MVLDLENADHLAVFLFLPFLADLLGFSLTSFLFWLLSMITPITPNPMITINITKIHFRLRNGRLSFSFSRVNDRP
jgi:hypothetical protein